MWYKWTKRILAGLGIFIVLAIAFVVSVIYIYEDDIKAYAIEQLNKNLKVKVNAGEIDLTLWDQFPNASLRFNDILIPDYLSKDAKDTMFYAQHIYLSFDFWDMLDGNYKVQSVDLENAKINLIINSKGKENFDVFKKDTTASKSTKFSFQLKELKGTNVAINYTDSTSNQFYSVASNEIVFAGDFSEKEFAMQVASELKLHRIFANDVVYIQNKKAKLDLDLLINSKTKTYVFKKGNINLEALLFQITGYYTSRKDSAEIDLKIKGKNIDLESAFSIFPKKYVQALDDYNAKGLVVFEATIKGNIATNAAPHTVANFYLSGGSLTENTSSVSMKNLSFDGSFDSDKKGVSELLLKDIKGEINMGEIHGELLVKDFNKPTIAAQIGGSINLLDLKKFINTPSIERLSGKTVFDANFVAIKTGDGFAIQQSSGNFNFKNTLLKLPASGITYSQVNGSIILHKNDATISTFYGFAEDSDFRLKGKIKNLIPYILDENETITIKANLDTKSLALDNLMSNQNESNPNAYISEDPLPFILPKNINFYLTSKIEELTYGKFHATQLTGVIEMSNQRVSAKNIVFNATEGKYTFATDFLQNNDNTFTWATNLTATDVNIANFMYELDNFGQDYLTDKNIKGKGNVSLKMNTLLSNDLEIDSKSLVAEMKIDLKDGELINQPSMLEIADYLNANKLVAAVVDTKKLKKKLKHIKFSELANTITVKDSKILIPKMRIATNVMDMNIAGVHGFDDAIDYHFKFSLREIMYKKRNQEEFGPLVDDGLGAKLYLHMFGNLNDPQYKIDSKEKHQELKENIAKEKQDVKSILKSELGLFKKDTSVKDYEQPKKTQPTFEVNWDEFDEEETNSEDTPEVENTTKKKEKKTPKFLKKWGIDTEEKKKEEHKIEVEFE